MWEHHQENPEKKCGGTRVLVPGHQNSGAPYLPDWQKGVCTKGSCPTVRKIAGTRVLVPGHQNSGAPTYFFQVFSSLHAHSCWPCSDKTRFCVEHINTLGKQEKLCKRDGKYNYDSTWGIIINFRQKVLRPQTQYTLFMSPLTMFCVHT